MYHLRMACDKCGGLWPVGFTVTFLGLCPQDGTPLAMTFHTTPLEREKGDGAGKE